MVVHCSQVPGYKESQNKTVIFLSLSNIHVPLNSHFSDMNHCEEALKMRASMVSLLSIRLSWLSNESFLKGISVTHAYI